jgi:hypothetical protein
MRLFQPRYFLFAIVLFVVEVLIAAYLHDQIVRPYIGDLLVVILLYCMVKSFFDLPVFALAMAVLAFAYVIEILQYFKLLKLLGWQDLYAARLILGNSFAWTDMLAYTLGIIIVIALEKSKWKTDSIKAT